MNDEEYYAKVKWGKVGDRNRPNGKERDVLDRAIVAGAIESGHAPSDIVGRSRLAGLVDVRFTVYSLCMKSGVFTFMQLGRCMGKDHGSIMNGQNQVETRLSNDDHSWKKFRDLYDRIEKRYKSYENDPERMVQELRLYDGRQGDDIPTKA